jgi:four helix bundle protein
MNYETWAKSVPPAITSDSLWKMEAYRLALFVSDLCWHDVTKLVGDRRTLDAAGQLYRAVGSIEANISEGYSRGSGRDRARFYEYALGSTRESRGWYYKGRHVLGAAVAEHRVGLVTHIARLLLTMIPEQRATASFLRENSPPYHTDSRDDIMEIAPDPEDIASMLLNVPMP